MGFICSKNKWDVKAKPLFMTIFRNPGKIMIVFKGRGAIEHPTMAVDISCAPIEPYKK